MIARQRRGPTLRIAIGLFISFLLLLASLNNTDSSVTKYLGLGALLFLLTASNIYLILYLSKVSRLPHPLLPVITAVLLVCSLYLISLFLNGISSRSFISVIQLVFLLGTFILFSLVKWRSQVLRYIAIVFSVYVLANVALWILTGLNLGFPSYMENPNPFGIYIYAALFVILIGKKQSESLPVRVYWWTCILLALILIMSSQARSNWVSGLVALFVFAFWTPLTRKRWRFSSFLLILLLSIGLFTYIYPNLNRLPNFTYYSRKVFELTGKNLYSRRQLIWQTVFIAIEEKPLFGHGPDALPSTLDINALSSPTTYFVRNSSHNWYLQITLQVGFVGLILFFWLFYKIWQLLWLGRSNPVVRYSTAFWSGMLIHEGFEVSLTQNNVALAIVAWMILAIGVSKALDVRWLQLQQALNRQSI